MLNQTLFCYSDTIKYQTDNKDEFNKFQRQAIQEGLKIIYFGYFPFRISEDGKIEYDENNMPIWLTTLEKIEKGITTLEDFKAHVRMEIIAEFEKSFSEITDKYPQIEREGWFFLTAECEDWLKNGDLNKIPALHAECQFSKNYEIISSRAREILEKSNSYKSFYGQMKANKADRLERLKNAKTPKEVLEIQEELTGG